jgi:pSer/pThr/pTyr-binding forkhead associated (FHA) protein
MPFRLSGPQGTWVLQPGRWTIGREASCRMLVDDARLSRNHAAFMVADDGLAAQVEDLGSANGVMVNGKRITVPAALRDGDVVVCGPVVLVVDTERDEAVIREQEPPRPNIYQRKPTEEMTPAALAGMMTPQLRPTRGPARHLDPAIIAAVATRSSSTSSTFHPSPSPSVLPGALSDLTPAPMPVLPPAPHPTRTSSAYQSAQDLGLDDPDLALEPCSDIIPSPRHFAWKRVFAGLADGAGFAATAGATAGLALVIGWAAGLAKAGAILDRGGLPVLAPGQTPPLGELLHSLILPGGLARAWDLVGALRQAQEQAPFLLMFLGATTAVLAIALTGLLGLVAPTVSNGAPLGHRMFRLRIAQRRNGHHPTWVASGVRWLALLVLWPVAWLWIGLGRRGPHDLIAGTEIRSR